MKADESKELAAQPKSAWERFLPGWVDRDPGAEFAARYAGHDVLITGASGSIGSALAKAIATAGPASLILLDVAEQGLVETRRSIDETHPAVACHALLGSVADASFLTHLFSRFQPDTIFHAAAFKHVALLESNPFAAIRNNALATFSLERTARREACRTLLLISTDKAVNPHSIMGVSKRLAELFAMALSSSDCRMNAVRLGNVIGSSGSVVPIFRDQIARGAAVTVTNEEASRYFLSAGEAVEAILKSGSQPGEAEMYLPEMGAPVRIADLARFLMPAGNLVRITGLGPGEKLTEDLLYRREKRLRTSDGLSVVQTQRMGLDEAEAVVDMLSAAAASANASRLLDVLASVVPEYQPSSLMREMAAASSADEESDDYL